MARPYSFARFLAILLRSCRLRCPRCGQSRLFAGWFRMHTRCETCGLDLLRGPGFYLGSIYFNYGLTALIVTVVYTTAVFTSDHEPTIVLWTMAAFCVLFPLWFFRYARALWLGMDEFLDPSGK